jgi:hypothetical protein
MNVPFSLLLAAERAIHPGTVAVRKEAYPDIARKSVGALGQSGFAGQDAQPVRRRAGLR